MRDDDDEAGHRLGDERFIPGECVSIEDDHRRMRTYRVVFVRPAVDPRQTGGPAAGA